MDLLQDENYKKYMSHTIIKKYPILGEKKNILYVPTFRKEEKQHEEKMNEFRITSYNVCYTKLLR